MELILVSGVATTGILLAELLELLWHRRNAGELIAPGDSQALNLRGNVLPVPIRLRSRAYGRPERNPCANAVTVRA